MVKPRGVDAKLNRLKALGKEAGTPGMTDELREFLRDRSNLVVADAAEIAGDKLIAELAPDLLAVFDRFLIEPLETDKGCRAKFAAVTALHKLEYGEPDVFLRGITYVQKEWRWGDPEPEDTAADLRGQSAFALVRMRHSGVLHLLADLLADEEKRARAAAAQALAATGFVAAIPLLRFKLRVGDREPDVMQECFAALIKLDAAESIPLVAKYLDNVSGAVQEAAALALAEARNPAVFEPLKAFAQQPGDRQEVALLALSLTRLPGAIDYLVSLVSTPDPSTTKAALSALAIHRHNQSLRARVAEAIAATDNAALLAWFEKKFRVAD